MTPIFPRSKSPNIPLSVTAPTCVDANGGINDGWHIRRDGAGETCVVLN